MESSRGGGWVERAESLILSLRDVTGVKIAVADDGEEIIEIHVMATPEREARLIARDVRSALLAALELDVDRKKISVVQRRPEMLPPDEKVIDLVPAIEARESNRRFRFLGLDLRRTPNHILARVELALGDGESAGEAEGPNSPEEAHRLIARATLRAVERFLPEECQFSLVDLSTRSMVGETVLLVGVGYQRGRDARLLTGSSVAGDDLQTAIVFATLAGLNRLLERLPLREVVEYELRPTSI